MEKMSKVLVVCVVGLLGILSLGTGFGAEVTKIKRSDIKADGLTAECEYPESPATALGITAAVALMMAQGILLAATGCYCCSKAARSNCNLRLLCSISGLTFFIATGLLIAGAVRNNGSGSGTTYSGGYYYLECYYARPGVFGAGGVLSGVSVVLGILYFLSTVSKDANNTSAPNNQAISVGQPQFPPNNNTNNNFVVSNV